MDEIPDIQVDSISIPDNSIDKVSTNIPNVQPVTLNLEQPNLIFEIPGCVEAHPDSGSNKKLKQMTIEEFRCTVTQGCLLLILSITGQRI